MALDISGINFFMPVFSFLFVFLIVYALLFKTKLLGDSKFIYSLISLIMAVVFMSFSSMELYIRTILPWFVVLFTIVFLVLLIAAFSTKSWDKIMTPAFAWTLIGIMIIIFIIAAIYVFNPVLHPDLIVAEGDGSISFVQQLKDFVTSSSVAGSIILVIVAVLVAWAVTKK